jgi:uncharacterized membrane protein YoaK (UPF0700 family)
MTPNRKLFTGLAFTACAGFTDAIGLIQLGGGYVSFMSGNTTQLGASFSDPTFAPMISLLVGLVVLFFAGGAAGTLLALSDARWGASRALAMVIGVLMLSLFAWRAGVPVELSIVVLAFAGGAQNAILPPQGAARLGATFVSGTLFSAGQDFGRALLKQAPRWRWLQHLAVWASLCGGAAIGALANHIWGVPALLLPALVYLGFLLSFLALAHRSRRVVAGA